MALEIAVSAKGLVFIVFSSSGRVGCRVSGGSAGRQCPCVGAPPPPAHRGHRDTSRRHHRGKRLKLVCELPICWTRMVVSASGLLRRRAPRSLVRASPPSAGPCRILFFGTYDSRRYQSVRVLLDGLVARGHDVTECNEPLGFPTAARVKLLRQPWRFPAFAIKLLLAWVRLWLRARRLPPMDAVVVGYMGHFDVHLARWLFRKSPIVLDHLVSARDTAIDRRSGSGVVLRILGVLDRAALRTADVIVVDTPEHRAMLPEDVRDRATVVAVGTPEPWFWPPRRSQAPVLRAVFFGSFTPLQGAPVIGEALGLLASDETHRDYRASEAGKTPRRLAGPPPETLTSPGSTGSSLRRCLIWLPPTTCVWASSATGPSRFGSYRARFSRARRRVPRSLRPTPLRSERRSARTRFSFHPPTHMSWRMLFVRWHRIAIGSGRSKMPHTIVPILPSVLARSLPA